MESRSKKLRSGYTTGACAAAAAKAAALLLLKTTAGGKVSKYQSIEASKGQDAKSPDTLTPCHSDTVEIPFPDASRVSFKIHRAELVNVNAVPAGRASVIKDAGDDPDVTNGAEIMAEATLIGDWSGDPLSHFSIEIKGGAGVGRVTKPGLSVPVGEAAINPVPRKMILEAVREAIAEITSEIADFKFETDDTSLSIPQSLITNLQPPILNPQSPISGPPSLIPGPRIVVTISVPMGEELAKKTLNSRLGIIGGISILGTTGIVRPLSSDAWTASISASMDVARAVRCDEVVISSGRTSEQAHMKQFRLPEEAYVMMGDYLEFSLSEARRHAFRKIHLCAQWAKMLKIALSTPQTHVRHGALDVGKAVDLLIHLGIPIPREREFNTAREIFDFLINSKIITQNSSPFQRVCDAAREYAEGIAGVPVAAHLVSYGGEIFTTSDRALFAAPSLSNTKVSENE